MTSVIKCSRNDGRKCADSEMCEKSTPIHSEKLIPTEHATTVCLPLTSSAEDFHVRTSATPARVLGSRGSVRVSGGKWPESFASYDPATSSWRTSQGLLTGGWTPFSGTWPHSGSMRTGRVYPHVPWVRHTHARECSLWPTPRASDRDNCGGSNARKMAKRNGTYIGRNQNPQVSEWLMGFPIDWSALPHSATPSSRKRRSTSSTASANGSETDDDDLR
jgi:hypothetical protein